MKALTIRQPWASLIATGVKTIETRGWSTKYRGPLAIHAGAHRPTNLWQPADKHPPAVVDPIVMSPHWDWDEDISDPGSGVWRWVGPLGVIVATVEVVACLPVVDDPCARNCVDVRHGGAGLRLDDADDGEVCSDVTAQLPLGDYSPGRWAWLLANRRPTTERCPWCWGDGGFKEDSMVLYGIPGGEDWSDPCPVCNPTGRRTEPLGVGAYGCDPIPAKGKQGLWEWTP